MKEKNNNFHISVNNTFFYIDEEIQFNGRFKKGRSQ